MKIVAISDTHNLHKEVTIPECDVLIHAGDATFVGNEEEMKDFIEWWDEQPARYKIFVPGNHEVGFYHNWDWKDFVYTKPHVPNHWDKLIGYPCSPPKPFQIFENSVLIDSCVEIEGIKFCGSPWTTVSPKWAFQFPWYERESNEPNYNKTKIKTWNRIPFDTDVLITHTPPKGILDYDSRNSHRMWQLDHEGDSVLAEVIAARPNLKYHIFGHIHEGYGKKNDKGLNYYNVSICNRDYKALNPVTIIEIENKNG